MGLFGEFYVRRAPVPSKIGRQARRRHHHKQARAGGAHIAGDRADGRGAEAMLPGIAIAARRAAAPPAMHAAAMRPADRGRLTGRPAARARAAAGRGGENGGLPGGSEDGSGSGSGGSARASGTGNSGGGEVHARSSASPWRAARPTRSA
ncbi:hypothetical protein ASE00_14280 [Sphingomonas sp. Root710]|nr:hypothetical protein ASE00_14280 [Sphingomonas sp. Root710]